MLHVRRNQLHYLRLAITKINVWHSIEQCTIDTSIEYGVHDSKHVYVLKAGILDTRGEFICIDKK